MLVANTVCVSHSTCKHHATWANQHRLWARASLYTAPTMHHIRRSRVSMHCQAKNWDGAKVRPSIIDLVFMNISTIVLSSSGHETSVAVKTTFYQRLTAPYATNCTSSFPSDYVNFTAANVIYTVDFVRMQKWQLVHAFKT